MSIRVLNLMSLQQHNIIHASKESVQVEALGYIDSKRNVLSRCEVSFPPLHSSLQQVSFAK